MLIKLNLYLLQIRNELCHRASWALLPHVKPEIALKESLELQFCLTCCLFGLAFIVQISYNSCHI